MNVTKQIQSALHYHTGGNLHEAEKIYRKILNKYPKNADALLFIQVNMQCTSETHLRIIVLCQKLQN